MVLNWSDLSRFQQRVLTILAHDDPTEEHVGVELGTLPRGLYPAASMLVDQKLVEVRLGWRGTVWVRLTKAGRQIGERRQQA